MAIELHRCPLLWAKAWRDPRWRVQKALDDMGVEYEIVKEPRPLRGAARSIAATGRAQRQRLPDGSRYREQSAEMEREIREGRLGSATERRRLLSSRAIAQLGERLDRTQEVCGSSPPSSSPEPCTRGGSSLARASVAGSAEVSSWAGAPAPELGCPERDARACAERLLVKRVTGGSITSRRPRCESAPSGRLGAAT